MKKTIFFFALIMSMLFTAQAGYVIRGITSTDVLPEFKNYTLTFDASGNPISFASMNTSLALGTKKNTIVVVHSNSNNSEIFPVYIIGEDPFADYDIEVRDVQYSKYNDTYVICGSRKIGSNPNAFVAVIDRNFSTMLFVQYPEADVFYSIWADIGPHIAPLTFFYACGAVGNYGVIAYLVPTSLQVVNFFTTNEEWVYHKIIAKENTVTGGLYFYVSGRGRNYSLVGLTNFTPSSFPTTCYYWSQTTQPASHCVVADYVRENDKVIVASSYQNTVTLSPVTFPLMSGSSINKYIFTIPNYVTLDIQDIGTIYENGDVGISVAGIRNQHTLPLLNQAWHGYVHGLSLSSIMRNNHYTDAAAYYEHYKVRYYNGEAYTGGFYQKANSRCALFATPLRGPDYCNFIYYSQTSQGNETCYTFNLTSSQHPYHPYDNFPASPKIMNYNDHCGDLKRSEAAEDGENEIIAFSDHIILKNIEIKTNYQIYNVIGQLVQTGTVMSDISTAKLGKGVYILRLESGKTFKLVK